MIKYYDQSVALEGHTRIAIVEYDFADGRNDGHNFGFNPEDEIEAEFLPDGFEDWKVYNEFALSGGCCVRIMSVEGD